VIVGIGLALGFCFQCRELVSQLNPPTRAPGFGATVAVANLETPAVDDQASIENTIERMAREAPLDLLREAQRRYRETIIDYTCTFQKQEQLDGELTKVQETEVKFREKLQSVYMHWTKNPAKARRVIYIKDKWTKGGEPAALCEPHGRLARVFVRSIVMPIHGEDAQKASRRSIDQFGFANALKLIIKYSVMAKQTGELKLKYAGEGTVDDRPTYVYKRLLPYTGEDGKYPDRLLVYHLDKETLLPVMCASYADDDGKQLLGQYMYTNVKLNPRLTDADFDGKTYNL